MVCSWGITLKPADLVTSLKHPIYHLLPVYISSSPNGMCSVYSRPPELPETVHWNCQRIVDTNMWEKHPVSGLPHYKTLASTKRTVSHVHIHPHMWVEVMFNSQNTKNEKNKSIFPGILLVGNFMSAFSLSSVW